MKTPALRRLVALLTVATVALPALAAQPQQVALTLLDNLQAGRFEAVTAVFSPAIAQALPAGKLATTWAGLQAQTGPLQKIGEPTMTTTDAGTSVSVPLHFERAELTALIDAAKDEQVTGLRIVPTKSPATSPPAPPPADANFSERQVLVAGLPGLLAMPKGHGPFPAVVLVHGSGKLDRDETVGPNRPFLDVARGLATQGIAVLRYDKRTYARPRDFPDGHLTLDTEINNDAVAAIALLAATQDIDQHHIYVLGHSEGGLLAPRIAARSGKAAGVILWAAPGRPALDLLSDQLRYLHALNGKDAAQDKAALDAIDHQIQQIRAGQDPQPALLGVPASYWREMDQVDAIAELSKLQLPALWLQGGRDFQVTAPDWARWKQALDGNPRATEHFYPALNHLGLAGEGPGNPAEYQRPGHVDPQLINDVASWIKAQP